MEVYALVGASGTGKSYHAMDVATDKQITHIIDDGILISRGVKLAGKSAKTEKTVVAAVKRAIFLDNSHAEEMKLALAKEKPQKLLVIGTSEHMIDRISEALALPKLKEIIFIEEISSPEEMSTAKEMRSLGKHIIPLPAVEVKKHMTNYWINPVAHFRKKKPKKSTDKNLEKSIVRPSFSALGKITISDQVVREIVRYEAKNNKYFLDGFKVNVKIENYGVWMTCETKMNYGEPLQEKIRGFQKKIKTVLEEMTGLDVLSVNIKVTGLVS